MNLLTKAIDVAGLQPLASACGVTYQAVRKWERNSRLPHTEATGETNYSEIIERETKRQIRKDELLRWSFPHLRRAAK